MSYELHPLCTLFPRLTGQEFDALREDIKENGLRQPIVLHEGMILDGGNRYRACIEAGVDPIFIEFEGGNLVSFVLSANLHRRHMSPGQQAAIVASAQDWAKTHKQGGTGANQHREQTGNVAGLQTVADRASQSGASERTQRMADKVAKADPELARKVAHGEVSLPKAAEQLGAKKARKKKDSTSAPTPSSTSTEFSELDTLRHQLDDLQDRYNELLSQYEEVVADNASMAAVFEADDKISEAIVEAKKYRELNRIAEERIRGLMNEKNEAIRAAKRWQRQAQKAA